jgi:hypothetical protein
MSSGKKSPLCCLKPSRLPGEVLNPGPIVPVSKASCGCCVPGHAGRTYPRSIRRPVPVGDACGTGKRKTSGSRPGGPFWPNSMPRVNSIGRKPSPMGALPRPKKGGRRRENETRQGHEMDGGGRRPRYSSGKPPGLGVPSRGDLAGADPGDGGRPPKRSWAAAQESRPCHL